MTRLCILFVLSCVSLSGCERAFIEDEPLPPLPPHADASLPVAEAGSSSGMPLDGGGADGALLDASATHRVDASSPGVLVPVLDAAPVAPDASAGAPGSGASTIAGSARVVGCNSWSARANGRCFGLWCGVSEQAIAAELQSGSKCTGLTAAMLCDGVVQTRLQACAIRERTNLLNLIDSEEMLRTKVQACFYEDPALMSVALPCLGCFLDSGECAGRNCLTECLASEGRSAACDQCRFDNNCFQPLPACAQLPSPF